MHNDIRESRAIPLIGMLIAKVQMSGAYDRMAARAHEEGVPDIVYCPTAGDALDGADACLIATEWKEFTLLNGEFSA